MDRSPSPRPARSFSLRQWFGLGGRPGGRQRRAARAVFETLEGRAVPAVLPLAVAAPPAVAPAAVKAAVVAPRVVAPAPAAPTGLALAAASDSGVKLDRVTNVVAPIITGRAAAGTLVTLSVTGVAGRPPAASIDLAAVRVPTNGVWTVRLPTLAAGQHVVTARAATAAGQRSVAATFTFAVDTAKPTAQISFVPNTDTIVVRFSEPVSGVSPRSFWISGKTADGLQFTNVPLTDPRIAQTIGVGKVTLTQSADGRTWTAKTQDALATPGTYTLRLAAAGIVDAAGNPLAADATLATRIV